jgi:hypothetical protein
LANYRYHDGNILFDALPIVIRRTGLGDDGPTVCVKKRFLVSGLKDPELEISGSDT